MTENEFHVQDILSLVAQSIRDRLQVLEQIDKTEAQTKIVNKHNARERLELLHLGIQVFLALLGVPGSKR